MQADGDSDGGAGLKADVYTDNGDGRDRAQMRRCIVLLLADDALLDDENNGAGGAVTQLCVVRAKDVHFNEKDEQEFLYDDYWVPHLRPINYEWGLEVFTYSSAGTVDVDNFWRRPDEVFNWWEVVYYV